MTELGRTRLRLYRPASALLSKKGKEQAYAYNEEQRKALVEKLGVEKMIA